MKRIRRHVMCQLCSLPPVFILLAAVLCGAALAYDTPELDPGKGHTSFAIPRAGKAPRLDGVISEGEWDGACMLNAMGNQKRGSWAYLYPRWVKWRLMWDRDTLYICAESQRLPNEDLRIRFREQTSAGNVVFDDSVEIHISPGGRNTAENELPWKAQAIINPLEVGFYSKYRWQIAARTTAWTPDWKMGSKIHEGSWVLELAVPRESLDLQEPNQAGDLWSFILARNWKSTGWNQSSVPCRVPSFKSGPGTFPFAHLTDGAYARLEDVSGLLEGRLHTDLKLGTSGKKAEDVKIHLLVAERTDEEEGLRREMNQTVTVEPDRLTAWKLDEKNVLKEGRTYRYHLKVTAPSLDAPILEQNFLVEPGGHRWLAQKAKKLEHRPFRFSGGFAPTRYVFLANADFFYSDDREQVGHLEVTVRPEDAEKVLLEDRSSARHNFAIQERFQLPELDPGTYVWEMKLISRDGGQLASDSGTFTKRNEAEAYEWWNFQAGDADRVLWPYDPIEVENGGARAHWWGGTFHLDGLCLPRQVQVTANRRWRPEMLENRPSVLARPLRIRATREGEVAEINMQGIPRTTGVQKHEASMTGYGLIGGTVEVESNAKFHQDGLLWLNLTLRPGRTVEEGKQVRRERADLDSLTIDIPLREAVARRMVAYGAPGKGSYTIGAVPEGDGVVWDCTEVGHSPLTLGNMLPVVWLGSWQRGLTFFARNNQGWAHAGTPDQQVLRRDGRVILRLNIIQEPVTLEGDRQIEFGFMPTPMRRMVPGWRMRYLHFKQNFHQYTWDRNASLQPHQYVDSRRTMFRNTRRIITRPLGGQEQVPHTERGSYRSRTFNRKLKRYFGPEWSANTWTRSFQDYQLYLIQRWIEEGGMTGIYHDQFYPYPMNNTITGAAWVLPDGRTNRGYNMLKDRRFNQREHAIYLENGIKPRIFCHTTNGGQLISYPWVTAILDGEANPIKAGADYDFCDLYPPERMQAYGNPWNWGNTFYWMRLFDDGSREWTRRQNRTYEGWTILHDVFWRGDQVFGVSRRTLYRWGLNDSRVKFWPYWANQDVLSCSDRNVLLSMWTLPDRALLCAFNYGEEKATDATINVPLRDLGLMPEVRSEFIESRNLAGGSSGFRAWSGELTVSIPAHDFRLISIRTFRGEHFEE